MAYDGPSPLPLSRGGTNATTMATSTGIIKYDGTSLVTSSTAKIDSSNRYTNTSQPAFQIGLAATLTNKTGAGTAYTIVFDTTAFDQGSNLSGGTTFTAPVTGKYYLQAQAFIANLTAAMTLGTFSIVTTANTYTYTWAPGTVRSSGNSNSVCISAVANMTAADTATVVLTISNGVGDTASVGLGVGLTFFSGELLC